MSSASDLISGISGNEAYRAEVCLWSCSKLMQFVLNPQTKQINEAN